VTSDGGLLLVRELDERLGLSALIAEHLTDSRGKNTQLPMADLLRQAVYSRLAGYEDVNDAERLAQGPTFRLMGSERIWERGAALTSRLQSFEGEDGWAAGEACSLLLAITGGRTSDAAAVRGDAGPDRAATATDAIASWWARQPRRIWLQRGWSKETCCNKAAKGAILGCAGVDGRPSGVLLDEK
jgi:hypothetical protein